MTSTIDAHNNEKKKVLRISVTFEESILSRTLPIEIICLVWTKEIPRMIHG